ncbi:MAG: polyphosphate:AMP phosphotransferase [Clostridiales bacterium]|nr:polyphosphate:AMP phosphotransferase [Clostridiales bacterium]
MSDAFELPKKPGKEDLKERLKARRDELFAKQMTIKEKKLPVLIIVEGWGTAGKGTLISNIIKNIDPRFFKVFNIDKRTIEQKRYPFVKRYYDLIPEQGKISIWDGAWMSELTTYKAEGRDRECSAHLKSIKCFERQLVEDGYLVIKLFLHISKKEQKKRIKDLLSDKNTRWRISDNDLNQNKHYDERLSNFEEFIKETNSTYAPWHVVDGSSENWATLQALDIINEALDTAFSNSSISFPVLQNTFDLNKTTKLSDISLDDKTISEEEYERKLEVLQNRLHELHYELYRKKIPVIIAYEGWDAAGKGGNIKRITSALDPRGYEVHPIASPEPHEKARHFLWRFWTRLPKDGHIAIFDRTWYGRVMVERLEGFCSENEWKRAYNEINEFEKELVDWGAIVIKFWVQIDKDTQLARFTERQNTPEKQWKITDEDWRNREKWDLYETAVDEMIKKTSTTFAPWYVLESNDKKYARIKALEIVIDNIERKLK